MKLLCRALYNFIVKSGLYCNLSDVKPLVNLFGEITCAANLGYIANKRLRVARGVIYELFSSIPTRWNRIIWVISFNCQFDDLAAIEKIYEPGVLDQMSITWPDVIKLVQESVAGQLNLINVFEHLDIVVVLLLHVIGKEGKIVQRIFVDDFPERNCNGIKTFTSGSSKLRYLEFGVLRSYIEDPGIDENAIVQAFAHTDQGRHQLPPGPSGSSYHQERPAMSPDFQSGVHPNKSFEEASRLEGRHLDSHVSGPLDIGHYGQQLLANESLVPGFDVASVLHIKSVDGSPFLFVTPGRQREYAPKQSLKPSFIGLETSSNFGNGFSSRPGDDPSYEFNYGTPSRARGFSARSQPDFHGSGFGFGVDHRPLRTPGIEFHHGLEACQVLHPVSLIFLMMFMEGTLVQFMKDPNLPTYLQI
ncbi:hypothetical protein POM88_011265 [Heracleum sosnowskyi]|uniref:Uncharacterized protein n=1 Tax=Heracleum sosnowskyi TaxID=360622 RepID=A0AAD8N0M3_9APIA|nr:hypothetical protein POM88_011265 [Heracleum sosnowskyi]